MLVPWDGILALSVMVPYQVFLSFGGGQEFIENGDRTCSGASKFPMLCYVFVANREGILGVVG